MPNKRKPGKKHAGAWLQEWEYSALVEFAAARGMTLSAALEDLIKRGLQMRVSTPDENDRYGKGSK